MPRTDQTVTQAGATVGSTGANVTITAGKDAQIKASDVIAGKNIDITGQNVSIQAGENKEQVNQTYEYKKSGLSVSVSSPAIDAVTTAVGYAQKAKGAQDERLSALYALKAGQSLEGIKGKVQNTVNGVPQKAEEGKKAPANRSDITFNIGIGSSSYKQESRTQVTSAQISNVSAGKDVNITATGSGAKDAAGKATDGDLNIIGSNISGENVNLQAAKDITLQAADNTTVSDSVSSGKSAGVGVQLGAAGTGVYAEASKSKGNTNADASSHTNTTVTAQNNLKTVSGNDTVLDGAKAKGETVVVQAGGDLELASRQDSDNYAEKNTTTGGKIGTGNIGVSASANKSNIDSQYKSVSEQTGLYAGKGGFDIHVGQNTDLKGAVIASDATADKNKLSTDTLTYSDIQNKADYSASSIGVNYDSHKYSPTDKENYKNQGLTPNIGVTATGNADSTTKSAIAKGTIDVRSNPKQDISGLSRNTADSLNSLGKIFDKKKVEEQQELAKVFGEEVFKAVGDLGLKEGSPEKVAVDTFVGGLMSKLGGGSFASGAASGGITQLVMSELKNIKDPAALQWASAIVGAVAAKLVGGNASTGASVAASQTKNNFDEHLITGAILITSFAIGGVMYSAKKAENGIVYLVGSTGNALAKFNNDIGTWVSLDGTNQQLIDQINMNKAANQQLQTQIQQVTQDISIKNAQIQDARNQIANGEAAIESTRTEIDNINADITATQQEIANIQAENDASQEQIDNLSTAINTLQTQVAELEAGNNKLRTQIADLKVQKDNLLQQIANYKNQYHTLPGTDTTGGNTKVNPPGTDTTGVDTKVNTPGTDTTGGQGIKDIPPTSVDDKNRQILLENLFNPADNIIINASTGDAGIIWPSKPHANGTEGHWDTIQKEVNEMVKSGLYDKIYVNKGLSNEIPGAKPNRRPDITGVRKDGKIDQVEVPSKTDTIRNLYDRMKKNQQILGDRAGDITIKNVKK